jgi:hypothetical protein
LAFSSKIDNFAASLRQANPNRLLQRADEALPVSSSRGETPFRTTSSCRARRDSESKHEVQSGVRPAGDRAPAFVLRVDILIDESFIEA